jgi:hypothetical protein
MRTNKLCELLLTAGIDCDGDTLKAMLVNTSYTPDKDHSFVSSITGGTSKELSGTGYVAGFGGSGRKTLTSKLVTRDDAADVAFLDAADPTWTGINAGTVGYVAIIKEGTSDADSPLLCIIDVTDTVTNGGDLTIQWAADGIFKLT